MSTAVAWDRGPVTSIGPVASSGSVVRRPSLVVIEGGGSAARSSHPAFGSRRGIGLAVPRWMRLAMTLSAAAISAALLLGVGGVLGGLAAMPTEPLAPIGAVQVRPGQTLSEIARAEMPGLATAEAVARIQLLNNLPSSAVRAGQVISIPGY